MDWLELAFPNHVITGWSHDNTAGSPDPQLIDPLQRCAARAANQRTAIAAYQWFSDRLGAGGAIELGGGLLGLLCHMAIIGPAVTTLPMHFCISTAKLHVPLARPAFPCPMGIQMALSKSTFAGSLIGA